MSFPLRSAPIALLILGAFVPAASAQAAEGRCYDVEVGAWSPIDEALVGPELRVSPPSDTATSTTHAIPPRLRLDRLSQEVPALREGWSELTIPEESQQTRHRFRQWRETGDTLHFILSTGFAGIDARLLREGSDWRGSARTSSDQIGILLHERPILLRAVSCARPPPIPASADPPLPRRVELADGNVIELGVSVPDGLATLPRPSGALTIAAEVIGRFAGADTLVAMVGPRGTVALIELRYPRSFDLDALLARLEAEYGARRTNRTTEIFALPSVRTSLPRLRLTDPRHGLE
jgi:hypothetical protein